MATAKYKMELGWKEFNLCLASVEAWMKANAGPDYCGNQAHRHLELWFLEEPSQEIKDAIQAHWDSLDEHSDEAVAYKSAYECKAEASAKKASGKAKLLALGLSAEEVVALVG